MLTQRLSLFIFLALALLLSACGPSSATPQGTLPVGEPPAGQNTPLPQETLAALANATPAPTLTPTPTPTATPEPLAARVNGEGLTLADFQAELARRQAAGQESGTNIAPNAGVSESQYVLDTLIDQTLLAQAAFAAGFKLDDAALEQRVADLAAQVDLDAWMQRNGYTPAGFRTSLRREAAAAWMRDQIAAGVEETANQVHVRQILLYNSDQAMQIYNELQNGQNFLTLAQQYDPLTAGDLGWFPAGYLVETALETAAFSLEVGNYSQVIETRLGFHIVQVIESDPERPLSPDARWVLQQKAIAAWLAEQRSHSTIETLIQP